VPLKTAVVLGTHLLDLVIEVSRGAVGVKQLCLFARRPKLDEDEARAFRDGLFLWRHCYELSARELKGQVVFNGCVGDGVGGLNLSNGK